VSDDLARVAPSDIAIPDAPAEVCPLCQSPDVTVIRTASLTTYGCKCREGKEPLMFDPHLRKSLSLRLPDDSRVVR